MKKSLVGFMPNYASILDSFIWIEKDYDFKEIQLPIIRERDVWTDKVKVRITLEEIK